MEKAKKKASKAGKKGKKKKSLNKTLTQISDSKSPSVKSDLKPKKNSTSFTLAASFLGGTVKNVLNPNT
jgi:hypothetical protein